MKTTLLFFCLLFVLNSADTNAQTQGYIGHRWKIREFYQQSPDIYKKKYQNLQRIPRNKICYFMTANFLTFNMEEHMTKVELLVTIEVSESVFDTISLDTVYYGDSNFDDTFGLNVPISTAKRDELINKYGYYPQLRIRVYDFSKKLTECEFTLQKEMKWSSKL